MRLGLFLLLLALAAGPLTAQYNGMSTARWSMENGLPDNYILSIVQDERGFLWLGTQEGLARFDGRQFRNFYPQETDSSKLRTNRVLSLTQGGKGRLLFVNAGELMAFSTDTYQFRTAFRMPVGAIMGQHPGRDGSSFLYGPNKVLLMDTTGRITDSLIAPVHTNGMQLEAYELEDSLWLLASELNQYLYAVRTRRLQELPISSWMPVNQALTRFQYYDPTTRLLYFSNYWHGLLVYDLQGRRRQHYHVADGRSGLSLNHISFVVPQNDSTLLVGTYGGGLNIFHRRTQSFSVLKHGPGESQGLPSNNLISCLVDPAGQVWIGTDRGLCRLSRQSGKVQWWDFSPGTICQTIQDGQGNTYAGVFYANRVMQIKDLKEVSALTTPEMPPVWTLGLIDQQVAITGGSMNPLFYDPAGKKFQSGPSLKPFFSQADLLLLARQDSRGDQWFSGNAGGGLLRREKATGRWIHYHQQQQPQPFSHGYFNAFAEDPRGNLWLGVNKSNHLAHWIRRDDRFEDIPLFQLPGLRGQNLSGINALVADRQGQIWIATDGTGIIRYDPDSNRTLQYTLAHGLPSDYVYSLVSDAHGRIWAATLKGLCALAPEEKKFRRFSSAQGIPFQRFEENGASFDQRNNRVWVSSLGHLIAFDPDSLWYDQSRLPRVYIDELRVNGQAFPWQPGQALQMKAGQNNLHVRFAAPDMVNDAPVEYEYRLAGWQDDWVSNGTIEDAAFLALPSGEYSLQVRARHKGDAQWVELLSPLVFTIAAPWYLTPSFLLAMLLLGGILLSLGVRWYLRQQLNRQRMHMEMELAVSEERNRLARELHDGLGSMLSGIKHSLVAVQQQASEPTVQQGLQHSVGHLDTSIKELRNISHSMASVAAQGGLVETLHAYCQQLQAGSSLNISFESLLPPEFLIQEEGAFHLFRIVQELMQNILKHAGASNVIVQLSQNEGWMYLTVEDDGKGFVYAEALRGSGMGLRNILQRVKVLRGKSDFRTAPGEGCSVVIEVPLD